jgi:heme O synthase-like polyprenyltransferase
VGLATAFLLWRNARLLRQPTARQAYLLFHTTNLYLALVMLAICLDVAVFA